MISLNGEPFIPIFKSGVCPRKMSPVFWNKLLKKVCEIRREDSRKDKTTFIIVDAQSVKNTDTAEQKGDDAGKKVSGIKRHIAVDTQG